MLLVSVMNDLDKMIRSLPGPLLVIGAGGFIGANLFHCLRKVRDDVFGTVRRAGLWRLEDVPSKFLPAVNLLDPNSVRSVLHSVKARVFFNCSSFGAYSFETSAELIYRTNFNCMVSLAQMLLDRDVTAYVHAGSSSEYGFNSDCPTEDSPLRPDSHYAVSKGSAALALSYYGKALGLPCANLRLYSVYGPYEDSSRLIPALAWHALRGTLPPLVDAQISRDFIHVDDVCSAFLDAAYAMGPDIHGESFNVGTGTKTTLGELVEITRREFSIANPPEFGSMPSRSWDRTDWLCNPAKAREKLGWSAQTALPEGLRSTVAWWKGTLVDKDFNTLTKKKRETVDKTSVSVVMALHNCGQNVLSLYHDTTDVCGKMLLDYEILFIDSHSNDDTAETVRMLSEKDPRVRGVVLSRDFGPESALRAGLELATKEAVVLIQAPLREPLPLIEQFVQQWRLGADVVYGRRKSRKLPFGTRLFHWMFHKLFQTLTEVPVPVGAADYCMLNRTVVHWVLQCDERESYLRGIRSYVGFNQVGVDYEELDAGACGHTESFWRKLSTGRHAIFSFSRLPLTVITVTGLLLFSSSILLGLVTVIQKLFWPESVPQGSTLLILLQLLFGTGNLLAAGVLGEYLGKVISEVKHRPAFIRSLEICQGEIRHWPGDAPLGGERAQR